MPPPPARTTRPDFDKNGKAVTPAANLGNLNDQFGAEGAEMEAQTPTPGEATLTHGSNVHISAAQPSEGQQSMET